MQKIFADQNPSLPRRAFLRHLSAGTAGMAGLLSGSLLRSRPPEPAKRGCARIQLDRATVSDFVGHVGSRFQLHLEDGRSVEMELIEAAGCGADPFRPPHLSGREPFSIVFRASRGTMDSLAVFTQGIYRMSQRELGPLELFLVPIGPFPDGIRLEAVFG